MIALTFTNCQQEDDTIVKQNKHEQQSSFRINKIEQFSLKEKPNLNKKINSLKNTFTKGNTSNKNSKLWYSNAYDFYIETDMVTYIENGTYHSYTFPIYGTENSTLLRNLLLSLQTDGTYSAFLITYNLSEQQLANLSNDQNITGDYDFSFTSLDTLDTSNIFNKTTFNEQTGCWEDIEVYHSNPHGTWVFNNNCKHEDELGFCEEITIITQYDCMSGGTGSPPTSSTDNSPNTNTGIGSNGSNTQNPDSTTPTYCKNCPEINDLEEYCTTTNALVNLTTSLNLTPNALSCLESSNCEQLTALDDYITNNPNESEFATLAAEAICAEGEVDFPNAIILDSTVRVNQKIKCVYDKLKGLSNTIFKDLINGQFGSSNENHVQITLGNLPTQLGSGTIAYTYTDYDITNITQHPGTIKHIRIDPNFIASASTIEIAHTLIHELIHAELLGRCIQLGLIEQSNTLGAITFTSTPTVFEITHIIFDQLLTQYNAYPPGGSTQCNHDLFNAFNYRTKMAQNLETIHPLLNDTSFDFLTNVNTDISIVGGQYTISQLMDYISWIGLEGTLEYSTNILSIPTELSKKIYVEGVTNTKYTNTCN